MTKKQFDTAIIGSGPGGYVAAIKAAQLGLSVALIEKAELGGVCLNWGCIPTKSLIKNAEVYETFQRADEFGIKLDNVSVDFAKVIARSRGVADQNSKGVEYLMKKHDIQVIQGTAEFVSESQLIVKNTDGAVAHTIDANHFIIATGARPVEIPSLGLEIDHQTVWSYHTALQPPKQPASLIIVGAGAIGVEFAYIYNRLGTKVDIVEMQPQLLPSEDPEIVGHLEKSFQRHAINLHTGAQVKAVTKQAGGVKVDVETGGKLETLEAEAVLVAVGIRANIEQLGLDKAGVDLNNHRIAVDLKTMQTSNPSIYAIGDCIDTAALAHVASAEAIVAAEHMADQAGQTVDYGNIPACTYCQPQVASIGLTEQAALDKGYTLKVGRFPFAASGKARAIGETEGMVKLIFDDKYGELLGAHIVGHDATEMIAELTVARALETTAEEVARAVHAHPTLSEAVMEAAHDALGEAIHI